MLDFFLDWNNETWAAMKENGRIAKTTKCTYFLHIYNAQLHASHKQVKGDNKL